MGSSYPQSLQWICRTAASISQMGHGCMQAILHDAAHIPVTRKDLSGSKEFSDRVLSHRSDIRDDLCSLHTARVDQDQIKENESRSHLSRTRMRCSVTAALRCAWRHARSGIEPRISSPQCAVSSGMRCNPSVQPFPAMGDKESTCQPPCICAFGFGLRK